MNIRDNNRKFPLNIIAFLLIISLLITPSDVIAEDGDNEENPESQTKTEVKIKFNANGGYVDEEYIYVIPGDKFGELPIPTKEGNTFLGWYIETEEDEEALEIVEEDDITLTDDITVYAKWRQDRVKVTFDANKGTVAIEDIIVDYGEKYGTLPAPGRTGYKFKGWYTDKEEGTEVTSSLVMEEPEDITLYARWAKISNVTFDYTKGKKGKKKTKQIVDTEKYGSLPIARRDNYDFKGWYTKKKGGTKVTKNTIVNSTKNVKLYAQWKNVEGVKKYYVKKGRKARSGFKLKKGGVTIHNTGNTSKTSTALGHAKYLKGKGSRRSVSWHYCVDDRLTTQSIPENEVAWHAGDGRRGYGNAKTVGIEIAMNKGGNLEKATDRAAKLAANILFRQGEKKAVSKVNIFQHYHFTKKNCPQMIRKNKPYSWKTFVKKVNEYLEEEWEEYS